ncbi:MAG: hypothetical protein WC516_09645 [Patescibacteria group bacterium]|jgi:hypothetical protein
MITEIEMLKKRVAKLEHLLCETLYNLKINEKYSKDKSAMSFIETYENIKEWLNNMDETYRTEVMRVSCRECLEDNCER